LRDVVGKPVIAAINGPVVGLGLVIARTAICELPPTPRVSAQRLPSAG